MLVGALLAAGPVTANADDRASFEAGRTAGRGLLILRDPRACGIALVRERCKTDVEAILGDHGDADFKDVPHVGAHPASGLRAFVTTGDRNGLDPALRYLNSAEPGFSHAAAIKSYTDMAGSVFQDDRPRGMRFVVGAFAAQLVYDAAIFHNRNIAARMSDAIADAGALDASIPGWSAARATLKSSTGGDWSMQYQNGVLLVALIEKANQR